MRDERQRSEPRAKGNGDRTHQPIRGFQHPAPPGRPQFAWQEWIRPHARLQTLHNGRHYQCKTEHHGERKLKARTEELLRIPQQNQKRRHPEGVQNIDRPLERPRGENECHHHRGPHGGGLPTGGRGIKPQQRNRHHPHPTTRHAHHAQKDHKNSRHQSNVQTADRKKMHRARAHKGRSNFSCECRTPTEAHCPQQLQRFILFR